ncbi:MULTISPECIES: hypothetical protein [unclassified Bradyrhizobium]
MNDRMPLFPDEKAIAAAVMGSRAKDWPAKARYLEDKHGLPRIDPLMGGRYWPAVVEFFNARHGLRPTTGSVSSSLRVVPHKPDGKEDYSNWPRRRRAVVPHNDGDQHE